MKSEKFKDLSAGCIAAEDLLGFGPGAWPVRSLRAKVGEKPNDEAPPDDGDDGNGNGYGHGNGNANSTGNGNGNGNLNENNNPAPYY